MLHDIRTIGASVFARADQAHSGLTEFKSRSDIGEGRFPEAQFSGAPGSPSSLPDSGQKLKRAADLALAVFLVPFVLTFGTLLLLLIMLDGGQPFFSHRRIGRNGVAFGCLKFRTMLPDAEARLKSLLADDAAANAEWAETSKLKNDPRVTRIGRFLRKSSLDELPQLWNIIRGEMSFVGPRPVTSEELCRYGEDAALYLACKPGITGLWQIHGRNDVDYASRVAFDARYARERSVLLDLRILLLTIPVVLGRKGAY